MMPKQPDEVVLIRDVELVRISDMAMCFRPYGGTRDDDGWVPISQIKSDVHKKKGDGGDLLVTAFIHAKLDKLGGGGAEGAGQGARTKQENKTGAQQQREWAQRVNGKIAALEESEKRARAVLNRAHEVAQRTVAILKQLAADLGGDDMERDVAALEELVAAPVAEGVGGAPASQ